jgi:hypothetical protein
MASSAYLQGRRKWGRPQAIIWSKNLSLLESNQLALEGVEGEDFIILSDHNRSQLGFSKNRIENKKRLVNGHLRSYHVADKEQISVSWEMLPSRSFNQDPLFNEDTGKPSAINLEMYTADGGAGGVDLVNWYENNQGSFYMFVAYDRYDKFNELKYLQLSEYNILFEVYFSSFEYEVIKRGIGTHDFWNISLTLEEV